MTKPAPTLQNVPHPIRATNKPHVLANLVTSTLAVLTLLGWAIVLFG